MATHTSSVSDLFNDYFSRLAMDIGFDYCVIFVSDAVAKRNSHPFVVKIRDEYHTESSFSFK